MKKHTKIYMEAFGYDRSDFIECEIPSCNYPAVDIHHIQARGMGGSKTKDVPSNLMALCRFHHKEYGDKKQFKHYLKQIHALKKEKEMS